MPSDCIVFIHLQSLPNRWLFFNCIVPAKLTALNGQLAEIEATRRREVDAVVLQKIANDARREQEGLAAAELAARNDYLANQRVSAYLSTLKLRQNSHEN